MAPTVLIVDDDEGVVFACRRTFEGEGYSVLTARDGAKGVESILRDRPDLVFMDITMPNLDGLSALARIKEADVETPIIMITGFGTMQTAIQAIQLGAYEYITKPLDVERVRAVAARALEVGRLRSEVGSLQSRLSSEANQHELVGNDAAMQEVYKTIGAVAATPNETPCLVLGESGTGKELVARAIHSNGPSPQSPFVPINCTALPCDLLESELFGYERGAFTGAAERRLGKFEVAERGSIFLDEIGDMPPQLQQKLLRVIQEREFTRLGGNETLPVRARFVMATHTDLQQAVADGRFRDDLYFRISVVPIQLPPLRLRKDDLPGLIEHLVDKLNNKLSRRVRGVSPDAEAALMRYDYPGNVRELENLLERAIILTVGDVILPEALPSSLTAHSVSTANLHQTPISSDWRTAREAALRDFEEGFIRAALQSSHGSVTKAARRVGLERQSFQRLMKRYGVESGDYRPLQDS